MVWCKVFVHEVQSKETHLFRQITKQGCGTRIRRSERIVHGERPDALTVLHVFGIEDVTASIGNARFIRGDAFHSNAIGSWVDPKYYAIMSWRLTVDKAGRIVIPKPLREALHLEPGDDLECESSGEEITLRPVRGTGPLTQEHGVWVFRTGQPMAASTTEEMLRQIREDRDLLNLGGDK
jgi:AbrB family looped-hinge helix DNA binding protein